MKPRFIYRRQNSRITSVKLRLTYDTLLSMATYNETVENIGLTLQQIVSDNMLLAIASRRITRAKLAAGLGVSGSLISQKIKGRTSWTIEDMEKAGRYLNIEPAWFLREHDVTGAVVGPVGLEPTTGGLLPISSLSFFVERPRGLRGRLCLCT